MTDLSVVIVSWNTRDLLASCLQSLYESADDLAAEFFVVDNGSVDGSASMVRSCFPEVRLFINPQNLGFAAANNQAIHYSEGRYILLLNSDTQVHPGALDTLARFMDDRPRAGACGPRLLNSDGSLQTSCHPMLTPCREFWRLLLLERFWRRATYGQERWNPTIPHPVEVIKGACLLLRKAALDQVGLLDEQYFMYSEEMDLCYRLAQAGWQLWWVPQAAVVHYGEASSKQMAEAMYVQLYRSKVQFHRKYGGRNRVALFKSLMGLAYVPRWMLAGLGVPLSPNLAARYRTYRRLLAELPKM